MYKLKMTILFSWDAATKIASLGFWMLSVVLKNTFYFPDLAVMRSVIRWMAITHTHQYQNGFRDMMPSCDQYPPW